MQWGAAGSGARRSSALVMNLLWIGTLKFEDYEVENMRPLVSSSPLFAPLLKTLGEKQKARIVGTTEIALASLIAAKPLAPRASVLGGLGAVGMFAHDPHFPVYDTRCLAGGERLPETIHGGPILGQGQRVPRRFPPRRRRVVARRRR